MNCTKTNAILAFFHAKKQVFDSGYASEVFWQESANFDRVTEEQFLKEAAWVILNSGMRESVIRKIFDRISSAFFNWKSAELIVSKQKSCYRKAIKIFNSPPKILAIFSIAKDVCKLGIENIKSEIKQFGIPRIQLYPFMGKATSLHFAKNLGFNVAKPDRHLLRIAEVAGFQCPQIMCEEIAKELCEKISVVDLIFWRFATLDPDYLRIFAKA